MQDGFLGSLCIWFLLFSHTFHMSSLQCLYLWHLKHIKNAVKFLRQYLIFTSLVIIDLLNVKMYVCLYFFTTPSNSYSLWLLAFQGLFLFPLV